MLFLAKNLLNFIFIPQLPSIEFMFRFTQTPYLKSLLTSLMAFEKTSRAHVQSSLEMQIGIDGLGVPRAEQGELQLSSILDSKTASTSCQNDWSTQLVLSFRYLVFLGCMVIKLSTPNKDFSLNGCPKCCFNSMP